MNLNEFVPTHLEDATPVDVHSTIYQVSGKFEKSNPDEITIREDIRYGVNKHLQLEAMVDNLSGGKEVRSGESKFSILYMPYEVENSLPVLGLNPFVAFPTGKISEGIDPGAKIILTSKVTSETQLHLNYQLRHNAGRRAQERAEETLYALVSPAGSGTISPLSPILFTRMIIQKAPSRIMWKLVFIRKPTKEFT